MDVIQSLATLDFVVIGVFIVALVTIGMIQGRKHHTAQDFFLAGRNVPWWMIGYSIFASNISAEHLVGLAGAGYMSGLLQGNYEWMAFSCLFLLAFIFIPYYLKTEITTIPEFLERRYSRKCRTFLAWLNVIANTFIRLGVGLYAGSLVIMGFFGWDIWTCVIFLSIIAASYTIVGGLAAVVVTESFSANIMIVGSIVLTIIGLSKVGGVGELVANTPAEYWSMLRPANDPIMPWYAIVFGYPILGIWYWCTDQLIVQRTLCARSVKHAQGGIIFASFLKIMPVFIFVVPGIIGYVLYPGLVNADMVYPTILSHWLPVGLRGVMVAVLLAAILSTMDAGLNSISTIFTLDIAKSWMPNADEKKRLWVARIATAGAMLIAMFWAPWIGRFPDNLFLVLNQLLAAISPPLVALFLLGALWKRTTPKAAELAMFVGEPVCVVLILANSLRWPTGFWPSWLNFMFLSFLLFIVMVIFMIVVSLKSESTPADKILPSLKDINKENVTPLVRFGAIILAMIMIGLYIVFH